jgi:hypothetical protein
MHKIKMLRGRKHLSALNLNPAAQHPMAVTVCIGTPGLGLSKPLETKYMTLARSVHGYTSFNLSI